MIVNLLFLVCGSADKTQTLELHFENTVSDLGFQLTCPSTNNIMLRSMHWPEFYFSVGRVVDAPVGTVSLDLSKGSSCSKGIEFGC